MVDSDSLEIRYSLRLMT